MADRAIYEQFCKYLKTYKILRFAERISLICPECLPSRLRNSTDRELFKCHLMSNF